MSKRWLAPLFCLAFFGLTAAVGRAAEPEKISSQTLQEHAIESPISSGIEHTAPAGILMLLLLFGAFYAMTRHNVPLPLAMTLVACTFLALQWGKRSEMVLREGFNHYAPIVVLFTAVAIPAHMIERSNGFRWFAAYLALQLSRFRIRSPRLTLPLLIALMLGLTFVTAGLMHNVTSILIMTPIIIRLCDSFGVPSRWLLCGALIASNLGGFSTKWGDTPNIVEAEVWSLNALHFTKEVVPANLLVLFVLWAVVLKLTQGALAREPVSSVHGAVTVDGRTFSDAVIAADWKKVLKSLEVDRHLLIVGLGSLAAFIILHVIFDDFKIAIGALTIVVAVLLERGEDRFHTLKSLGFDVYLAFAAIFVLAGCVGNSWIGDMLQRLIESTGSEGKEAQPWAICLTGYLGTMFTEAASWATLASGKIHPLATSHSAAWALGGGICAGSSSLITAASAGIILAEESARFKEPHAVTFRRYIPFGLSFSLFMLVFYSIYFSVFHF
jgi:Na+/H+ antiporter NhaD/arsenite permease-like protein